MKQASDTGTCVVLVCVTNKNNKILTHDKFFKLFSSYGRIQRILIFERAVIWKTFVEYDNLQSAIRARQLLNGQDLIEDGLKMNVYASNLERITFQENNSGGIIPYFDKRLKRRVKKELHQTNNRGKSYLIFNARSQSLHQSTTSPSKSQHIINIPIRIPSLQKQNTQSSQFSYQMPEFYTQPVQQEQRKSQSQSLSYQPLQNILSNSGPQQMMNYGVGAQRFQILQHQIQLQQFMSQSVQRINQLIFMIQQINSEQQCQIQYNQEQGSNFNYERQVSIITELQESNIKLQQLTDQYQRYIFQNQNINNNSNNNNNNNTNGYFYPKQQGTYTQQEQQSSQSISNVNNQPQRIYKQSTTQQPKRNQSPQVSPIVFISEVNCDSQDSEKNVQNEKHIENLLQDDNFLLPENQPVSAQEQQVMEDLNDFGISNHASETDIVIDSENEIKIIKDEQLDQIIHSEDSKETNRLGSLTHIQDFQQNELQKDEDEKNNLFSCFEQADSAAQVNTKQILSCIQLDLMPMDKQQSVVAMIENHIHQHSFQKSSQSLDEIDLLINKNKIKQQEIYQQQQQQNSPEWNKNKIAEMQQIYDDINEDQDPAEYVNPLFLKVVRKSKVIYARWFDRKLVTLKMLYNIFSTFGNIDKMIYLKERSSALIQYQSIEHATQAKECLNDITFYGQQIKIFYSNYEEIFLKSNYDGVGYEDVLEEYFLGTPETHRFKEDHNYSFNPPSDTIQIANLAKESCSNEKIQSIFGNYELIRFIYHAPNRNLCIIKYENIQTSLMVLSNLHNCNLDSRCLQLSFSKLKNSVT